MRGKEKEQFKIYGSVTSLLFSWPYFQRNKMEWVCDVEFLVPEECVGCVRCLEPDNEESDCSRYEIDEYKGHVRYFKAF